MDEPSNNYLELFFADEEHWIQQISGVYSQDRKVMYRGCLIAALVHFYPGGRLPARNQRTRVKEAIAKLFPKRCNDVILFNDHKDTIIADIRAVVAEAKV